MADNTEKARELISLLREGGIAKLGALLDEQIVMEMPFAPAGLPSTVSGKAAVLAALGSIDEYFERFRINVHESYATADGQVVILECTGFGIYRRPVPVYQNRYAFVFRFRDGLVAHWREFSNPYPVIQTIAVATA